MNISQFITSNSNTDRQYKIVNNKKADHLKKLSSGYRINQAADDAAGISISTGMRAQIRGLDRGVGNTEEGLSLCQVADSALVEVHEILQRINQLSIQAANDTNTMEDRININAEIVQLQDEINRIGDSTEFNTQPIFKGGLSEAFDFNNPSANSKFFQVMGPDTSTTGFMQEPLPGSQLLTYKTTDTNLNNDPNKPYVGVHINFENLIDKNNNLKELAGTNFYVNCCTNCCPAIVEFTDDSTISASGKSNFKFGLKKADGSYYTSANEFVNAILDQLKPSYNTGHVEFGCDPNGSTLYIFDTDNNAWTPEQKRLAYFCDNPYSSTTPGTKKYPDGFWIQSGGNSMQGVYVNIGAMNASILGINSINVLTRENATDAISKTTAAIQKISDQRVKIGAYENRFHHIVDNENQAKESMSASESRISDADMAKEMMAFSQANILSQAGESMLAQASKNMEGMLPLLD